MPAGLESPGIQADGQIVGERVRAGEIEVDNTGKGIVQEESIVREEVCVDRALWE